MLTSHPAHSTPSPSHGDQVLLSPRSAVYSLTHTGHIFPLAHLVPNCYLAGREKEGTASARVSYYFYGPFFSDSESHMRVL